MTAKIHSKEKTQKNINSPKKIIYIIKKIMRRKIILKRIIIKQGK